MIAYAQNSIGKTILASILIVVEILFITFLGYKAAGTYYSLDVFYCLPIIQAAHLGAIRSKRHSDKQLPTFIAIGTALAWSVAEAIVVWPYFPLNAFMLNAFSRSVTFTVVARVVTKIWKERELARKDELTDLDTRREFFDKFNIVQLGSDRSGIPYSLIYIDIDKFKALNDNKGHHIGDKALKVLSEILLGNTRRVDIVSRFGGDEFIILCPETDEQSREFLVTRIVKTANNKFQDQGWPISLSIGQVTHTGIMKTPEEILHEADLKMYSEKKLRQ